MSEQVAQPLENVLAREPLGDIDRQALPSERVHDCQPSASGSACHRRCGPRLGNSSRRDRDASAAASEPASPSRLPLLDREPPLVRGGAGVIAFLISVHTALVSWIVALGIPAQSEEMKSLWWRAPTERRVRTADNGIVIECNREEGAIVDYQCGVDLRIMSKEFGDRVSHNV